MSKVDHDRLFWLCLLASLTFGYAIYLIKSSLGLDKKREMS